jgi:hypothetical protein
LRRFAAIVSGYFYQIIGARSVGQLLATRSRVRFWRADSETVHIDGIIGLATPHVGVGPEGLVAARIAQISMNGRDTEQKLKRYFGYTDLPASV